MKLFKIPFLGRGGIGFVSGDEGVTAFGGELSIKLIPGANRKKEKTLRMRYQELRNLLLRGDRYSFGVVGRRCVTTAGVTFLRDAFLPSAYTDPTTLKYHDCGIGTGAEAVGNTALGTPWGGARATGTQDATTAKTYKSVATIAFNASKAITEHGLFSASSSGTLWDRTLFSAIDVISGDSIEFTYSLLINDGG